jgi:hypothetical protein
VLQLRDRWNATAVLVKLQPPVDLDPTESFKNVNRFLASVHSERSQKNPYLCRSFTVPLLRTAALVCQSGTDPVPLCATLVMTFLKP